MFCPSLNSRQLLGDPGPPAHSFIVLPAHSSISSEVGGAGTDELALILLRSWQDALVSLWAQGTAGDVVFTVTPTHHRHFVWELGGRGGCGGSKPQVNPGIILGLLIER